MTQADIAIKHEESKAETKDLLIQVLIDDKECYARVGESLLSVARNHNINIPTLCDLKKLTPTGACRMCVVEEDNGNIVASCKSFVTKPIRIYTQTEKLQKFRNQIMSFLCINHPLECGVCDKSGECELQDKVLESKVAIQPFFAVQKQNDYVHFHNKVYNEALCIMCERCARTCNEYVGNSVLSVLAGGFHSKIGVDFNAYCEDCDECVSVCPTGAMFSTRFTYTSNAWELEKNESHCIHCSLRCPLHYEVKHNIDSKKEIYRIKNEAHAMQLCHAGRHNFLRQNLGMLQGDCATKGFAISKVLSHINALRLGTNITNEEAYLAALLAQKANIKIYCDEALHYKEFSSICNYYVGVGSANSLKDLQHDGVVIILGSYLYDEMPILRSDLSKLALKKGVKNIWISSIAEERFQSDLAITYEVSSELAISALLLSIFVKQIQDKINTLESNLSLHHNTKILALLKSTLAWIQEQDLAYLMAESNVSESEIALLDAMCNYNKPLESKATQTPHIKILVGQDFYLSKHYRLIAQILSVIALCKNDCSIIPLCYDNIHAISLLCDLTPDDGSYCDVLGIRANADFSITPVPFLPFVADSKNMQKSIPIVPLQFMEGSVIDMYGNLVKLYPSFRDNDIYSSAQDCICDDLLDICGTYLELDCEYIVELTSEIPFVKEFMCQRGLQDFDSLESKMRLDPLALQLGLDSNIELFEYCPEIILGEGSGIFIYKAALSGNLSFYRNEYKSKNLIYNDKELHGILKVSKQFCIATKLQDNEIISLQVGSVVLSVRIMQTSFMKGMVAVLASDCVIDSIKYFDYKVLKA